MGLRERNAAIRPPRITSAPMTAANIPNRLPALPWVRKRSSILSDPRSCLGGMEVVLIRGKSQLCQNLLQAGRCMPEVEDSKILLQTGRFGSLGQFYHPGVYLSHQRKESFLPFRGYSLQVRSHPMLRAPLVMLLIILAGCGGSTGPTPNTPSAPGTPTSSSQKVAINDLGSGNYLGFTGGLYPSSSNTLPAQHHTAGLAHANAIQPLDLNGNPSASGKYVLLSIGMSNTTQEFCSAGSTLPCDSWTFMGQAATDASVNHTHLAIVDGAAGGKSAAFWILPTLPDYDRIRDTQLTPQGLSEKQVQAVWLKVANPNPTVSLPNSSADAYTLLTQEGQILRALKTRYPNLQQVFVTSRIYAGYATSTLNPEPYAYESGFSNKWLIEAQINQMNGGTIDDRAGDLNYNNGTAPWVAWGPYLWADGLNPR